jgi:uncharacterized protein (TIGR03083 family)
MSDVDVVSRQAASEYGAARRRVTALLRACDPATLDAVAPATPKWRVRDVLSHVVGVVDDAMNNRLDGVTTEPWTAAQVAARRECSVADILDEWDRNGPGFEEGLTQLPAVITGQVLFDVITHEHDMRQALGRPGDRDVPAITMIFDWMAGARTMGRRPALRFDLGDAVVVGGAGDPVATVRADRFELVRAATGRRSASEVVAYGWEPPVEPTAILINEELFRLRDAPLNE